MPNQEDNKELTGFKGFKKRRDGLYCLDFKYTVGETVSMDYIELCCCGFHYCPYPLNVLSFYPPGSSVYCTVSDTGCCRDSDDRKRVTNRLKITREISINALVNAAIHYLRNVEGSVESSDGTDNDVVSSMNRYTLIETGRLRGVAVGTGNRSVAHTRSSAAVAVATGEGSAAKHSGRAAGVAVATSRCCIASNIMSNGVAVAMGDSSHAEASGWNGVAIARGSESRARTTSRNSLAIGVDEANAEALGEDSIAIAGPGGCAKGVKGGYILLYDTVEKVDPNHVRYKVYVPKLKCVDGKRIKENVYYKYVGGKLTEVSDENANRE